MTTMTILDVVNIIYPGQFDAGNIRLGQDGNGPIFITKWAVPNENEPSIESLEAQIPLLQAQFDLSYFLTNGQRALMSYIDGVAQERQYDSALSCASYLNSSIPKWSAESNAFIGWRDAVFSYALGQIGLMNSGQRSVPSFQEFQSELPLMVWPE